MSIVYIATSPSGKKYIGKTDGSMQKRKLAHEWHAHNGSDSPIRRAIRKYGDSMKWDILVDGLTSSEAISCEVNEIKKHGSLVPGGYNCTEGGEGAPGFFPTQETRDKMSASRSGIKFSEKHRQRISKSLQGKKRPQSVKNKVSKALLGRLVWHDGEQHSLHVNNKTGFHGVSYHKCTGKFIAQITVNRKRIYIGIFNRKEDAAMAYDVEALRHFGSNATVNIYHPEQEPEGLKMEVIE